MSTRSTIAILNKDESIDAIYCRSLNGYPSGLGMMLHCHYTTTDEVKSLIALGNLRYLGETPESSYAYIRDLGRTFDTNEPRHFDGPMNKALHAFIDFSQSWYATFFYLWDGCRWMVARDTSTDTFHDVISMIGGVK
jgi:hypothetical protein